MQVFEPAMTFRSSQPSWTLLGIHIANVFNRSAGEFAINPELLTSSIGRYALFPQTDFGVRISDISMPSFPSHPAPKIGQASYYIAFAFSFPSFGSPAHRLRDTHLFVLMLPPFLFLYLATSYTLVLSWFGNGTDS